MKDRHGANEVFLSTEDAIGDDDIDRILDTGQHRTNALKESIVKTLPSDEQLFICLKVWTIQRRGNEKKN